jgi:uncharacterized protein (UPF0332 family)
LYYSAFQTVAALMVLKGVNVSKHTHVRGYVNKEIAVKGLIDKEQSKLFNKLMEYRSDADYNNEIFFNKETALNLIEGVEKFNESVRRLIAEVGEGAP